MHHMKKAPTRDGLLSEQTALRLAPDMRRRLMAQLEVMQKQTPWCSITIADVMRRCMSDGLDALEKQAAQNAAA